MPERMTREFGKDRADPVIVFTQTCHVSPLDAEIALSVVELYRPHKFATADAVILATPVRSNEIGPAQVARRPDVSAMASMQR